MSDAPPMDSDLDDLPEQNSNSNRQYPRTPMPNQFDDDVSDAGSDESSGSGIWSTSLKVLFIAIAIAHLWTVWTVRTDMNILMQFLREITQQNKHITDLLHNQHQVKWQIVPTQL